MSLTSEKYKEEFACTGGVAYNVTDFRIWASEDEEVVHVTTAGVETTLTPTTSYAISNIASTGFTVTTVQSYSSGTLVVRRNQPKTQEADWERNGPLSTPVLEEQLDKIVAMIQSNAELLARTILQTATADSVLAFPVASASALIGWNSAGTALENTNNPAAAAAASAAAAALSETAAELAETHAETAETNAETAETNAGNSATDAAASAEAISGWEVASEAEAEAGTNNTKLMTPLRTAEANAAQDIPIGYLDTDGTLAANSDTKIPSQKAVKTFALPLSYLDTDTALAADSDTKVASQKAVKAYADSAGGGPKSIQVFTSSGTWTRPSGVTKIMVEVIGGGGGGGAHAGGGGGAGGYSRELIDVSALASETVTVGGAGSAGTTNGGENGGAGGTSSFGSYLSCTGGALGYGGSHGAGGGVGGTASNGDLNSSGGNGIKGYANGGGGGSSFFGCAIGYGGGGHGGVTSANGNIGGAGVIIVTEY